MKRIALSIALLAAIAGCAVQKDWVAIGGSKADGVVRLAYDDLPGQVVQVSETQAVQTAARRCKSWGYSSAEAFGGVTSQCVDGARCKTKQIIKEYQCTGEVRLNLTTPLWHHPFSVADRSASRAPCGRKRQRRALSLPARGSDRAGRCPALVSAVQRPNGRETLPNPPCGPLCASAPSGPAGYARRCRLRAGSAHSE